MKKQTLDLEKIIFTAALVAIAIFVISLFSFTMVRFQMTGRLDAPLRTQLVEDGADYSEPTIARSSNGTAQTLIIVGALAFSLLGGAIFLGLKVQDKYM